ncbi:MAG: hypothetical protein ACREQF_12600 [Candidatus Binataceae bacterium]
MSVCKERRSVLELVGAMLKALTIKEIERIFAVIEPMGISREAVVIPLRTEHPGRVHVTAAGKLEIVVDRDADFDEWIKALESQIRAQMEPG